MAAKFVLKSVVTGGLVYGIVKVSDSIWVAPNHSLSYYKHQRNFVNERFPGNEEAYTNPQVFEEMWNQGVKKLFRGLLVAPDTIKGLSEKAFTQLKDMVKNSNK